ncbi:MAG: methyltransferase domain-containing protein [Terrimicrobiaceae bacterium]|nr:methyltransferase domain-containing protein [Terrimicrobiaceae bacterium]
MISSPSPSATEAPEGFLARRARLRRIAWRFPCSLPMRGYIIGKIATDPAYRAVLDHLGDSNLPIMDIGCGLGLLAHYLRDRNFHAPIHGFDFDARKIRLALSAAEKGGLRNLHFAVGDATHLPATDANLVLFDVLHYIEAAERPELLRRLAARARSGAAVLIRVAVHDASWRCRLTALEERWTRWSGWIPSPAPVQFPTIDEIVAPFEAAGCHCEVRPLWGRTPFNSHLFVARYAE